MVGKLSLIQKVRLARLALGVQLWWPPMVPVMGVVNLFLAYALFDGPRLLPVWLHGLVAAAALMSVPVLLWRRRAAWVWPTQSQAIARLERDNKLNHHPIGAVFDTLVAGDSGLWDLHRQRMQADLPSSVKVIWPRWTWAVADPLGWRFWVFVPLALGVLVGAGDAGPRLGRILPGQIFAPGVVTVWVSPPRSTGLSAFVLPSTATGPVAVPVGSTVRVLAEISWGRVALLLDDSRFVLEGEGTQHTEQTVQFVRELRVEHWGFTLGRWQIAALPDLSPKVGFSHAPQVEARRGAVRVGVQAADDYGVTRLWLRVQPKTGSAIDIDLPGVSLPSRQTQSEARINNDEVLAAGQMVTLTPMAQDNAGQQSSGEAVQMVWPERPYTDALAQALNRWRQVVAQDPRQALDIAQNLDWVPLSDDDLVQALALGAAKRDLQQSEPDLDEAQALLLGAANARQDRAQHQMVQKLRNNAQDWGKADSRQIQAFAELMERLLDNDDPDGDALPLGAEDLANLLRRLDQLAVQAKEDGKLRQRLENLAQNLAGRMKKLGQGAVDPLGHGQNSPGGGDDRSTKLPGMDSHQILDEIRSRMMDPVRPVPEREYLKRLLDWE